MMQDTNISFIRIERCEIQEYPEQTGTAFGTTEPKTYGLLVFLEGQESPLEFDRLCFQKEAVVQLAKRLTSFDMLLAHLFDIIDNFLSDLYAA